MALNEKLLNIQQKLNAPKNQRNNFGNYNYRSCEDILEAVKPLLKENKCVLNISDEVVLVGERYYIKAKALVRDVETGEFECSEGLAREEESKKGMDSSQITGAASSYARKYALNGLFCIDDNKDSDSTNTHGKDDKKSKANLTDAQVKRLYALANKAGYDKTKIEQMISAKYKKDIKSLSKEEYDHVCNGLEGKK
ncbi:MAG: ERF family protein [Terrisporobacter othiniensis]|uniref:ERF family protein n=1 Tax=Terrisporobacter othiniensis TaxID=1577792 RepID=UPI002A7631E3|nr:ERF family protein [Terrisporobacter othiniensis]MDY3373349.1 ERF family protein [Terrisporobacter othiniensis]